ncbi:terminase small subunit [Escherichia coli]|nr:terminase small subunit [Escherichia coli]EHO0049585.1 terminase small subunit [Escherichia coli]EIN0514404.1 terminase small subunit [Escherichia coli]EJC0741120.1 terminase small subunit [Escherichia coli]EKG4601558.1 terminase small subunit [Escherichia coli]
MRVNKKKLAEIFDVDVRTISTWQNQGLPLISGGGIRCPVCLYIFCTCPVRRKHVFIFFI